MRLLARAGGVLIAAAAAAAIVWLLVRPGGGRLVQAYFSDARGLVAGADVRINGAPAGSVTGLSLARGGLALVTMRLSSDIPYPPRADATAAIRPVDLLGDNYLALTLGHARAPLRGPIPASRTLDAPQLADLLNAFRAPQRTALGALLVGLGETLDQRGADLNQAALELRPALQAAGGVMAELSSQNADLRQVIADADALTAQAAARNLDLGRSVSELSALLALTARHSAGLKRGLQTLPQTLGQLGTTATRLQATAQAADPLAQMLRSLAPTLAATTVRLPAFLHALRGAALSLSPALRSATATLVAGDDSIHALAGGLSAGAREGLDLSRFAAALVPAAPDIAKGFFDNFPNEASEPGNQPFDPFANPLRDYWRGAAVFSCESFGLPIAPGCLSRFLAAGTSTGPARRAAPRRAGARPRQPQRATSRQRPPLGPQPPSIPSPAPVPSVRQLTQTLAAAIGSSPAASSASAGALAHLVQYLLH
jgi:ABC-type transporter Mla subunit MlaD